MSEKKVKTCKTCGKQYTGRYCKNRQCPKNLKARLHNRARARASRSGKMRFSPFTSSVSSSPLPTTGQGGVCFQVNPSAVPAPVDHKQEAPELVMIDEHRDAILRANRDFDFFILLCDEGSARALAAKDEQDYFRTGA